MGIIDRIILSVYMVLLIALSIGIILASFQVLSLEFIQASMMQLYGHWEAGLSALVFLLVSVRLLLAGGRSRTNAVKNTIRHHNEMGDIHISLEAIKNLVEKTTRHTRGVRGVRVTVNHTDQQGLKVFVKAVVSPESNVPSVSADMQRRVHEYIKHTVGIELADISIFVENISNDFKSKHRVE